MDRYLRKGHTQAHTFIYAHICAPWTPPPPVPTAASAATAAAAAAIVSR